MLKSITWKLLPALALTGLMAASGTAVWAGQPNHFLTADADEKAKMPEPVAAPPAVSAPADHANACNDCCDKDPKRGGVIGGAELLFLKPHNSEGVAPVFDTIAQLAAALDFPINEPEFDLEPAWRVWLGYQTTGGLGALIRYFEFDQSASATTTNTIGILGGLPVTLDLDYTIEARALDLVVFQAFNWDRFSATIGAGYRYAEYLERNVLGVTADGDSLPALLTTGFESYNHGLIIEGEIRRRIGSYFALLLGTRAAAMFGDEDEILRIGSIPGLLDDGLDLSETERDNVKWIWEGRAGAEVNYPLSSGAVVFGRFEAEVQYWDKVTGTPIFNSNAAFGLAGIGLSVGIER